MNDDPIERPASHSPAGHPVTLRDVAAHFDLSDALVLAGGGLIILAAFRLHPIAGLAILGLGLAFLGVRLTR